MAIYTHPGPVPKAFYDDSPYQQEAILIEEIISVDPLDRTIHCRMSTDGGNLPWVDYQKDPRGDHPTHVPGGVLVHVTSMLGLLYSWCVEGIRFNEGWVGYGARIYNGEVRSIARIGPPLDLRLRNLRRRSTSTSLVLRLAFEFTQEGRTVYRSEQTGAFRKHPLA